MADKTVDNAAEEEDDDDATPLWQSSEPPTAVVDGYKTWSNLTFGAAAVAVSVAWDHDWQDETVPETVQNRHL